MIEIINFAMTSSLPVNYVLDVTFTLLIKAILPVKMCFYIIEKATR